LTIRIAAHGGLLRPPSPRAITPVSLVRANALETSALVEDEGFEPPDGFPRLRFSRPRGECVKHRESSGFERSDS
jgi:hypothetical protein